MVRTLDPYKHLPQRSKWGKETQMQYDHDSNPKHKQSWQRGRRGSLCPAGLHAKAQTLLLESVKVGKKRYAVHEGKAYCAQQHGKDLWHGYPVGWMDLPQSSRNQWISQNRLKRREVRKHWGN